MKKSIFTVFLISVLILVGCAQISYSQEKDRDIDCFTYDDFSNGSLNPDKWTESTLTTYLDEHFISSEDGGVYHTAQLNPGNADVVFTPTREFNPGEILEHTVNYVSGEGNQQFQYMFNDATWSGGYTWLEDCTTPSPGCNGIGHWNGDTDVGAQLGVYNRRLEFLEDRIFITTTRPDGTQINHTAIDDGSGNLVPPYTVHLIPHTGHNGITHFDFDNFEICVEEEPPQDTDNDGIIDELDNCINTPNTGQWDLDNDGVGDWCDNCPLKENLDQLDSDGNDKGDACERCSYEWEEFCIGSNLGVFN